MATRREKQRTNTIEEIKMIARSQMATQGAANVSLRGIAREMEMAVTALYRYFPSYDDLITALIVDAFNALADAMIAAQHPESSAAQRLWDALMAYYQYARDYPHEFALIYGTPLPGYHAPGDLTDPVAARPLYALLPIMNEGIRSGAFHLPDVTLDAHLQAHYTSLLRDADVDSNPLAVHVIAQLWTRGHGIVLLNLFNHLTPMVGDVEAYLKQDLYNTFIQWGIPPP